MALRGFVSLLVTALLCPAVSQADDLPLLRRQAMVIVGTQGVAQPSVKLATRKIGHRTTPLQFEVIDDENRLLKRGFVGLNAERDVPFAPGKSRMCLFQLDCGLNGYHVQSSAPYAFLASKAYNFHSLAFAGKLHFFVPKDSKKVEVWGLCLSPNEGATLTVRDPEDKVAATLGGELPRWERMAVNPPPHLCGKVWSLEIGKHQDLMLDDVEVYLDGDAPPILAVKPEWAARIAELLSPK
ncbi:MAG: hypothetical protein FJ272_03175 [Planctomycetes bacterium]|nr:hypothetical protein [Planctomycetota bacterium]